MTGVLTLSDHPAPFAGAGTPNGSTDLQAATKLYVDNNTYYSGVNLYVSVTKGDDLQRNTPPGREGRAWQYAYKTVSAAALQAETLINLASTEPGPYRQTIAYTIGPTQYKSTVLNNSGQTLPWLAGLTTGAGVDTGYLDAVYLLKTNKEFIQAETIAYLNRKYVNQFTFDDAVLSKIIGDILTGVSYDLVFTNNEGSLSNYNSVTQASLLFNSDKVSLIDNYYVQLIDAINYAKQQVLDFSFNTTNTQHYIDQVINALCYDLIFGSNYQSIQVALLFNSGAYTDLSATEITGALTNLANVITTQASWNTTVTSSPSSATTIKNLITTINNIIVSGQTPAPVFPDLTGTTAGQSSARYLLINNIPFIQSEMIAFITANFPNVQYSKTSCERDLEYVIWSLTYDMMYGGNSQTVYAGLRYWLYSSILSIDPASFWETIYGYLNTLVSAVITNTPPAIRYQQSVNQYTNAIYTGGSTQASGLSNNLNTFIDIIGSVGDPTPTPNTLYGEPAIITLGGGGTVSVVYPTVSAAGASLRAIRTAIQSQKIGATFSANINSIANTTTSRLIVTSALGGTGSIGNGDIITGTSVLDNTYIISGAGSIWVVNNSQTVISESMTTGLVLGAVNYINSTYSIINDVTVSTVIRELFNVITGFISDGYANRPAVTLVNPPDLIGDYATAKTILFSNLTSIKTAFTTYISAQYPLATYDSTAAQHAIGYVVEALAYDLVYGANTASSAVAQTFIMSANATGQGLASIYADAILSGTGNLISSLLNANSAITVINPLIAEISAIVGASTVTVTTVNNTTTITARTINGQNVTVQTFVLVAPTVTVSAYGSVFVDAQSIIKNNNSVITNNTLAYLRTTYTGGFNYN
jgi:hypothetical protein